MGKAVNLSLVAMLLLAFGTAGWGQYYQYRDENGVLRYTDDLSAVPPEQRKTMKTHESIVSAPVQAEEKVQPVAKDPAVSSPAGKPAPGGDGSWLERVAERKKAAEELDRMQVDLNRTFMALQNERSALAAKQPSVGATEVAKQSYRKKVKLLNQKIERYEGQLAAFQEKEKKFKAMGKQ